MTDADAAKAGLLDHICHDEGSACPSCADFRAAIAAIEALQAECLEQARLNGMGAEREAALMARVEALQAERDAAICRANEHEDRADLLENRWVIDTGKLTIRAEKTEDEVEALQAESERLKAEVTSLRRDNNKLLLGFHAAIQRPMGVVPAGFDNFYDATLCEPELYEGWETALTTQEKPE